MIQRFHGIERHKKFSTISVLKLEDDYWHDCKGNR